MTTIFEYIKQYIQYALSRLYTTRIGEVTNVDPTGHLVRVKVMPEAIITGWIPLLVPLLGVRGVPKLGDQAFVSYVFETPAAVLGFSYNNVDVTEAAVVPHQYRVTLGTGATTADLLIDGTSGSIVANGQAVLYILDPRQFGAIGDGASHPLSGTYATLAAAQAVYPFATDLRQELDYCGIQKAINVALGTLAAPAPCPGDPAYPTPVPTRTATNGVLIRPGSYHINTPVQSISASGLVFSAPGARFIPANVPGTSSISSIFHWDGIADCSFGDLFVVAGDGTEAISEVFSYQWSGASHVGRSSTHNVFRRIGTQGSRYITGWAIGTSSGALQVDQSSWYDCCITGDGTTPQTSGTYFQDGWKLGSGVSGNIIGLGVYNCQSFWHIRGINVAEAKGVYIGNMTLQGNAKDYQIASEDAVVIDEGRSEGAGMFLSVGTGPTASAGMVDIRNVGWSGAHATDDGTGHYKWAELDWAGTVRFTNCRIEGNAPGGILPYIQCNPDFISNSGLAQLRVVMSGMQSPNTLANFMRGNTHVDLLDDGYNVISNGGSGFSSGGFGTPSRTVTGKMSFAAILTTGLTVDNANLYRGGANLVKTDGGFTAVGTVTGQTVTAVGTVSGATVSAPQITSTPPASSSAATAAITASPTPQTIVTISATGTDESPALWEAQQFNTGTFTAANAISLRVKAVAGAAGTSSVTAKIYTDNAGQPGTLVASNLTALYAAPLSTASYTQVYLSVTGSALTASTTYWVVLQSTASSFFLDSDAGGTSQVATSPDGTTWTVSPTKRLWMLVLTPQQVGIEGLGNEGIGVLGTSVSNTGAEGTSTYGTGVIGTSTHRGGVQGTSVAYFGGQFSSTWQEGVFSSSQQGIGIHALQTGSLVANTSGSTLVIERSGTPGAFAYSGATLQVLDNPSGTDSATNLLQMRSKLSGTLADRFLVDQNGGINAKGGRMYLAALSSAPTDANIAASQVSFWLDEVGNALTFRVRYSGGTYKTGTVALV